MKKEKRMPLRERYGTVMIERGTFEKARSYVNRNGYKMTCFVARALEDLLDREQSRKAIETK